jgi:hypothetical protein
MMSNQIRADFQRARPNGLTVRIDAGVIMGLNRTVLKMLKSPAHLHFWWGEREKVLAISAADEPTDLSVPLPEYFYGHKSGCRLKNVKLLQAIKGLTGWEDGTRHLLDGEFVPELNLIVFKTDNAGRGNAYYE